MPGTKALRFWLILSIVLLWLNLISQLCHEILLPRMRSPENVLHPLQRTYPLHAGLITAVTGLVALCAPRWRTVRSVSTELASARRTTERTRQAGAKVVLVEEESR